MNDAQRLSLFKQIAGTSVYEAKRGESVRLMQDTARKNAQIEQIVRGIRARLSELEGEKSELLDFQRKDGARRTIERSVYLREKEKCAARLEVASRKRRSAEVNLAESVCEAEAAEKGRKEARDELGRLGAAGEGLSQKIKRNGALRRRQSASLVRLEARRDWAKEVVSKSEKRLAALGEFLESMERRIDAGAEKSREMERFVEKLEDEKTALAKELGPKKQKLEFLQAKCGRKDMFSTKSERDEFLLRQVSSKKLLIENDIARKAYLSNQLDKIDSNRIAKKGETIENEIKHLQSAIEKDDAKYVKDLNSRNKFSLQRKKIWKELDKVNSETLTVRNVLSRAESSLRYSMAKGQYDSIRKIKESTSEGYRGCLSELFTLKHPKFAKCVEKTAGSRLFFHVVDDDEIAARLIATINRQKLGRTTVMPLNRLNAPKELKIAEEDKQDVIPMLKQIDFEEKFRPAMAQIFGKTVIARSIDIASAYSIKHNVDAITLDGDRASKRGYLSGGYNEGKTSRLEAIAAIKKNSDELETLLKKANNLEKDKNTVEISLERLTASLNLLESEKEQRQRQLRAAKEALFYCKKELQNAEKDELRL
ncbi:Structural maintenance of chromosomes protein 3, partial [Bonamia ostreae]